MCQSIQTLVPFSVAGSRSSVMLRERLLVALRENRTDAMKSVSTCLVCKTWRGENVKTELLLADDNGGA